MNAAERIAKLEAELAAIKAELIKSAEVKPWEPKGGEWSIFATGQVGGPMPSEDSGRLAGSEYPTQEAAESALPYVTFFKRLCCLAAELNPSGRVGGPWKVFLAEDNRWEVSPRPYSVPDPWDVFETREAALRAACILNRDDRKVPALPGQGGVE